MTTKRKRQVESKHSIKDYTAIIKLQEKLISAKESENKAFVKAYKKAVTRADYYLQWIDYYKQIERYSIFLEQQVQHHIRERNEVTRAYNGLHTLGKFAEELDIDIKKYRDKLPENNEDFEFSQSQKLLESGKVKHSYKLKKKKSKKTKEKK